MQFCNTMSKRQKEYFELGKQGFVDKNYDISTCQTNSDRDMYDRGYRLAERKAKFDGKKNQPNFGKNFGKNGKK